MTLADRQRKNFLKHCEPITESGCWIWTGGMHYYGGGQTGYGRFGWVEGRVRKCALAHRMAYELFVGPIPDGLLICHRCDVTACVNPTHLFVGTHADNLGDMVKKGREKRFIRFRNQRGCCSLC